MRYDSKAEAIRAVELDLLVRSGHYESVERQVKIELGVPEIYTRVDFVVADFEKRTWAEEVKGFETPEFRRIRRLWKAYGPFPLVILKRRGNGWTKEVIVPRNGKESNDEVATLSDRGPAGPADA